VEHIHSGPIIVLEVR